MALLDANGGWPIIMGQAAAELTNLSWQTIDNTYNRMFGGSSFFKISYEAKDEDSTSNILTVSFSSFTSALQIRDPFMSAIGIKEMFKCTVGKRNHNLQTRVNDSITSDI